MTKVLIIGDLHLDDRAPANCHDTYNQDLLDMLTWLAAFADEQQVDAVVQSGDVFNRKSPSKNSHALILQTIETFSRFKNLWIVPGNHDMSNDRLDSIAEKQPLGVIFASGAAKMLNGWHPDLPLYGVPWRQDWTINPDAPDEAFAAWRGSDRDLASSLAVTHAPVYPPDLVAQGVPFDLVPTSGPGGLSEAMGGTGSIAYGHIHEDHGIFQDGGVTFANVGAISRGSLHEYNLSREVKVAIWTDDEFVEIDGEKWTMHGVPYFYEVVVPHKPAEEVFRLDVATLAKTEKMNLDDFLAQVGSASLDISSTASVVAHLRSLKDVPEDVVERAVRFLEEVDV